MDDIHYHAIKNGEVVRREDKTIMTINPSAYFILSKKVRRGHDLTLVRDQREKRLTFAGGEVKIGKETPYEAAVRETYEETGVRVIGFDFVGQFGHLEPVSLFETNNWAGDPKIVDPTEVSELLTLNSLNILKDPKKYISDFYPATWKMLGWYLNYFLHHQIPMFDLWSNCRLNPWPVENM